MSHTTKNGNGERDIRLEMTKYAALAFAFFFFLCVLALVLGSLALLSDACKAMRASEQTFNRGWVVMGWWISGLSLSAYDTHQHFLVNYRRRRSVNFFCLP